MADPVEARKRELRRRAKTSVSAEKWAEHERASRSEAIAARLRELPPLRACARVAAYASLPGEVASESVIADLWARGAAVVLPRIDGPHLRLYEVRRGDELVPGPFGVTEPSGRGAQIDARSVEAFLVPGLYFDRSGQRLGRGWGYYDRLLASARLEALRVGLCFASRVLDAVPVAEWDQRVDYVITELETIGPLRREEDRTWR